MTMWEPHEMLCPDGKIRKGQWNQEIGGFMPEAKVKIKGNVQCGFLTLADDGYTAVFNPYTEANDDEDS
jgi:formylmethanofuran dehydrogenase subunit C